MSRARDDGCTVTSDVHPAAHAGHWQRRLCWSDRTWGHGHGMRNDLNLCTSLNGCCCSCQQLSVLIVPYFPSSPCDILAVYRSFVLLLSLCSFHSRPMKCNVSKLSLLAQASPADCIWRPCNFSGLARQSASACKDIASSVLLPCNAVRAMRAGVARRLAARPAASTISLWLMKCACVAVCCREEGSAQQWVVVVGDDCGVEGSPDWCNGGGTSTRRAVGQQTCGVFSAPFQDLHPAACTLALRPARLPIPCT